MKKRERFAAVFIGLSFLGGIPGGAAPLFAAEAGKYACVDVAKVFDQYQKTKDNDKLLQEAGKKKEKERDVLVNEIRQMKDELLLLSDEAKEKKREALQAQVKKLSDFDQNTRQGLGEQRNQVVQGIFKDIDNTVQRYGERKGLELIFNERALLYHHTKLDITQEILNELNKEYTKKR
jgi:Skp family chaperone for outer membrane proteins